MLKKFLSTFFVLFSFVSFGMEDEIYRDRMKELIKEIRLNTTKDKILITQNGSEIYFKNGEIDKEFLKYTNGASQESLFYGEGGKLGKKTSKKEKNSLLENLNKIKENGKTVFSVNYSKSERNRKNIKKLCSKYDFVGEEITDFSADRFNIPINGFNRKNILSLKEAENFLYLLNPHKFKDTNEYFIALKSTDYDVLIIEPSLNGKFFTKNQIEKLKYKYTGEKRLVIAYFSIGEAENYRSYWNKSWNKKLPFWIAEENKNWKGNFIVKYWSDEWKKIIKNYQKKLDSIGVDGYYLDTIDSFYYFEKD